MDKLAEIQKLDLNPHEVCFVGDGIQDCEAMGVCRLSIAPNDASEEAKEIAHGVTSVEGGNGVLHEIVSLFLKERGLWPHT
jgi:3-deoxy-D-manno-octulosonate 8-phosphate phosphatase (KDO 8-P phosphatase)